MFSRLVKQLAEKEGVTEALKAENQNAVGAEDEQHPQRRYGDCFKRFNLRITNIYRKAAVNRRRLFLSGSIQEVIKFREQWKKASVYENVTIHAGEKLQIPLAFLHSRYDIISTDTKTFIER